MIRQAIGKNWRDVMAYERFQFKMWHACGCDLFCRPCDGVLAGGICDSATPLSRLQPEDLDEE